MIIKAIVVRNSSVIEDTFWVAGAWDEYTYDENAHGFDEEVQRNQQSHGHDNVRILDIVIPEDALAKPFEIPVVKGEPADG